MTLDVSPPKVRKVDGLPHAGHPVDHAQRRGQPYLRPQLLPAGLPPAAGTGAQPGPLLRHAIEVGRHHADGWWDTIDRILRLIETSFRFNLN